MTRNALPVVIDFVGMRTTTAPRALIALVVVTCSACATTTAGIPQPVTTAVTATSTVTAAPDPPAQEVFRAESVELGVAAVLREDYKISDVGAVECPEDQPVVVGTSFRCEVRIGGLRQDVTITVRTADGEYEVGQPRG